MLRKSVNWGRGVFAHEPVCELVEVVLGVCFDVLERCVFLCVRRKQL